MNSLITPNGEVVGPVCVVLVGLPASGKSTWRESLGTNFVFVSSDDYIEDRAIEDGLTYSKVFSKYIEDASANMHKSFADAIENGESIVWDQTNLSLKKRRGILGRLPKHYSKVAVYFEITDELRSERLKNRHNKFIPKHVIVSMKKAYVRPTKSEGFDMVVGV